MKRFATWIATWAAVGSILASPAVAQSKGDKSAAAFEKLLANTVRRIVPDICLPATSAEYEGLGKNAVLMLTSSSVVDGELPLRGVYLDVKGTRVPLHRVMILDKREETIEAGRHQNTYTRQVSFYVLPIMYLKQDVRLMADFTGQRTSFGIMSFSRDGSALEDAPAFARLDEYDAPGDPDPAVIAVLLAREYPDIFMPQPNPIDQ